MDRIAPPTTRESAPPAPPALRPATCGGLSPADGDDMEHLEAVELLPAAAAADFDPHAFSECSLHAHSDAAQYAATGSPVSDDDSDGDVAPVAETTVCDATVFDDDHDSDADDSARDGGGDILGQLNQYLLLEKLGKGSQGEVFLAVDTTNDELRAIKAIPRPHPGRIARRRAVAAFAREVGIMKRLRHRGLITLHEVIDDPSHDAMYLVMQYVEHGPLASMRRDGTVSRTVDARRLIAYADQVSGALQSLHRNGVIHRDVKPENLLLGADDRVYLADFGVSEAFDAGGDGRRVRGTNGTPAFLAPELLQLAAAPRHPPSTGTDDTDVAGDDSDCVAGEAVDVWALGLTLYALLYGKLPWEFTDARDLFEAIQRRPIELRPAALSPALRGADATAHTPFHRRSWASPFGLTPAPGHELSPSQRRRTITNDSSRGFPEFNADSDDDDEPVAALSEAAIPAERISQEPHPFPDFELTFATVPDTPVLQPSVVCDSNASPASPSLPQHHDQDSPALRSASFVVFGHELSPRVFAARHRASSSRVDGVAAATDEGWRRLLHGMLQRDPHRRFPLSEVRRRLVALQRIADAAVDLHEQASRVLLTPGRSPAFAGTQSV